MMYTGTDQKIFYQALLRRDSQFEGIFYYGVKTTGIFCRPDCRATKPLEQNVIYFQTPQAAVDAGYRPCKVCAPLSRAQGLPNWLVALFAELQNNPESDYKDAGIRRRGIEPARLRRWMQKNYGMTFHSYVKALRMNQAFAKLHQHDDVTATAVASGYESFSGFHQAFKDVVGVSPLQSKHRIRVSITQLTTPLGSMYAGASDQGICFLEFIDRKMIGAQIQQLQRRMNTRFVPGKSPWLDRLAEQLEDYFRGHRRDFELPLHLTGSAFQLQAWEALRQIPYGEKRSYQQQAESIGRVQAVRAIASANAKNHIAIVLPCHRVIAKNGGLAGFGGGIWRKKYLLELEAEHRIQA